MTLEKKQLNIVLKNWKGVFKMGKVKITQKQADKIWGWEMHTGGKSKLLELHAKYSLVCNNCLQSLTLDELARALYVGYEVEVEVKVGDLIIDKNDNYKTVIEITEIETFHLFGNWSDERGQETGICIMTEYARHATESEIAAEKGRRMDSKIDGLLVGLSSGERVRLREKLECGDY